MNPLASLATTVSDLYRELAHRCAEAGSRGNLEEAIRIARLTDALEAVVREAGLGAPAPDAAPVPQDDPTPPTSSST